MALEWENRASCQNSLVAACALQDESFMWQHIWTLGMSCPSWKLDIVGRQFEVRTLPVAPLWCDLGRCSQTVVVIKLRRTSAYTINPMKHSPCCTQDGQVGSEKEFFLNLLSTCPKQHHAKTAAYNQVYKVLADSLHKRLAQLGTTWQLIMPVHIGHFMIKLSWVKIGLVLD